MHEKARLCCIFSANEEQSYLLYILYLCMTSVVQRAERARTYVSPLSTHNDKRGIDGTGSMHHHRALPFSHFLGANMQHKIGPWLESDHEVHSSTN